MGIELQFIFKLCWKFNQKSSVSRLDLAHFIRSRIIYFIAQHPQKRLNCNCCSWSYVTHRPHCSFNNPFSTWSTKRSNYSQFMTRSNLEIFLTVDVDEMKKRENLFSFWSWTNFLVCCNHRFMLPQKHFHKFENFIDENKSLITQFFFVFFDRKANNWNLPKNYDDDGTAISMFSSLKLLQFCMPRFWLFSAVSRAKKVLTDYFCNENIRRYKLVTKFWTNCAISQAQT
jgi:hypothetical protein